MSSFVYGMAFMLSMIMLMGLVFGEFSIPALGFNSKNDKVFKYTWIAIALWVMISSVSKGLF